MTMRYTVGMTIESRSHQVEVEAEDALIAALKAKVDSPSALIVYVRKANARGDKRHPHAETTGGGLSRGGKSRGRPGTAPRAPSKKKAD